MASRMRIGRLVAVLVAGLAVVALGGLAAAHATVAESSPRDRERLSEPPRELRVVFTEPIEAGVSRLRLVGPQGEVAGTEQRAEGDRTLVLRVPELPAGDYRIEWEILAKDGHVTRGTISFTVAAAATRPPSEPQPAPVSQAQERPPEVGREPQAPAAEPAPATRTSWPLIAAVGVIVVAGLALGARAARRR